MAIRLHHTVFRTLATWMPGAPVTGADRLMETGGITVPTLMLLHDYACQRVGMEPGTAALIYLEKPGHNALCFGERVSANTVEGATYTEVRLSLNDAVALYHEPASAENKFGTHRLEYPEGGGSPTPGELYDISKRLEVQFNQILSGTPMIFLVAA